VRPLRGAKWENELQICDVTTYCMQWGFWLLRLILDIGDGMGKTKIATMDDESDDANEGSSDLFALQRMIGPKLCECMVRYLYTPCEPNKDQVVIMLSKLLRRQTMHLKRARKSDFGRVRPEEMLQLQPLNQLGRSTIRHVRSIMEERVVWPKHQLQLLVELAIATHAAEDAASTWIRESNIRISDAIGGEQVVVVKDLEEPDVNVDETLEWLQCDTMGSEEQTPSDGSGLVSRQGPWKLLEYNARVPALAFRRIAINWGDWRNTWSEGVVVASRYSTYAQSYSVRFDSGETHNFDDFRAAFDEHPDWQWKTLPQKVMPLRCVCNVRGSDDPLAPWDNLHEYEMQLHKMQTYMGIETFERKLSNADDSISDASSKSKTELWWRGIAVDGTAAGIFPASAVESIGPQRLFDDMWTPITVRASDRLTLRQTLTEIDSLTDQILADYSSKIISSSTKSESVAAASSTAANDEKFWSEREDELIVQWVNQLVAQGRAKSFAAVVPRNLPIDDTDQNPDKSGGDEPSIDSSDVCALLQNRSVDAIRKRFGILQRFNMLLRKTQRLVDMSDTASMVGNEQQWSLGSKMRRLRDIVFLDNKMPLLDSALRLTECTEKMPHFELDQFLAQLSEDEGLTHPAQSQCIFAQAFRILYPRKRALFRNPNLDSFGIAQFKGSMAADAGGVFREALSSTVESVFSSNLALLLRTPNHIRQDGDGQDLYVPNPEAHSKLELQMFEFLGIIMGMAIRMKFPLPFRLPSLAWKRVLNQGPSAADLSQIDRHLALLLDKIRNCEKDGITSEALFEDAFGCRLSWAVESSSGEEKILKTRGLDVVNGVTVATSSTSSSAASSSQSSSRVQFKDRAAYVEAALTFRLHEYDIACTSIRRGLSSVVPMKAMQLFTWRELEVLVCGVPEISMRYLQKHTVEQGWGNDRTTVVLFWKAFEKLNHKERSGFVKFAWARERLPRGNEVWSHTFKLTRSSAPPNAPPKAHTCFFQVEMPVHTSLEAMEKSLGIAIASANQTVNMVEY